MGSATPCSFEWFFILAVYVVLVGAARAAAVATVPTVPALSSVPTVPAVPATLAVAAETPRSTEIAGAAGKAGAGGEAPSSDEDMSPSFVLVFLFDASTNRGGKGGLADRFAASVAPVATD